MLSICRKLGRGGTTGGVRIGPVSIKDHKEVEINMLDSIFYELSLFSPKALNELISHCCQGEKLVLEAGLSELILSQQSLN